MGLWQSQTLPSYGVFTLQLCTPSRAACKGPRRPLPAAGFSRGPPWHPPSGMASEITWGSEPMSSESIPTTSIICVVTFNLGKPCLPPKPPDQQKILGHDFCSLRNVFSSVPASAMKPHTQSSRTLTANPRRQCSFAGPAGTTSRCASENSLPGALLQPGFLCQSAWDMNSAAPVSTISQVKHPSISFPATPVPTLTIYFQSPT